MNRSGLLLMLPFLALSCNEASTGGHGHSHGPGGHAHGESTGVSLTQWTDQVELFVEYNPMVVSQISSFTTHITRLPEYKPLDSGKVTVSLIKDGRGVRNVVDSASAPGIFVAALRPNSSGLHSLVFDIESGAMSERVVVQNVQVYDSASQLPPSTDSKSLETQFFKEQAWGIDFAVSAVQEEEIHEVVRTSGEVESILDEEVSVVAKAAGIVSYRGISLVPGQRVTRGAWICSIKGGEIIGGVDAEDNLTRRFSNAESQLTQAKLNYERGQELHQEKVISDAEFEMVKTNFELAQNEYDAISENYHEGGIKIYAPKSGFIKEILVEPGEYVRVGGQMLVISQNDRIRIQVNVPYKYYRQIREIETMNFKTSDGWVYDLKDLNGKLVSYSRNLEGSTSFVPVFFEIDNTIELVPGSFLEIYLKINPKRRTVVVPLVALMEDYGTHSVFVQTSGESFEKRSVSIGVTNGIEVEIKNGLSPGEMIVTTGAYQVKMAAAAAQGVGHGHVH